jgi:hypothetical protein
MKLLTILSICSFVYLLSNDLSGQQTNDLHTYYFPPYLEIKASSEFTCDNPEEASQAIYFLRAASSHLRFRYNETDIIVRIFHDTGSPEERMASQNKKTPEVRFIEVMGFKTLKTIEKYELDYFNFEPADFYYSITFKNYNGIPNEKIREQFLHGISVHKPSYFDQLAGYPFKKGINLDSILDTRRTVLENTRNQYFSPHQISQFRVNELFLGVEKGAFLNPASCLADYYCRFTWQKYTAAIQKDIRGDYTQDEFYDYHFTSDSLSGMAFVKKFIPENYFEKKGHLLWNKYFPESIQALGPPSRVSINGFDNPGFLYISNWNAFSYSYIYKKGKTLKVKDHIIQQSPFETSLEEVKLLPGVQNVAEISFWYASDSRRSKRDRISTYFLDLKTGYNDWLMQKQLPYDPGILHIVFRHVNNLSQDSKPDHWHSVNGGKNMNDSLEFQLIDFAASNPTLFFAFECYDDLNKRYPREKRKLISPYFNSDYDEDGWLELWQVSIINGMAMVPTFFEDSEKGYSLKKTSSALYAKILDHEWVKHWSSLSKEENLDLLWPPAAPYSDNPAVQNSKQTASPVEESDDVFDNFPEPKLVSDLPQYPGGLPGLKGDISKIMDPFLRTDSTYSIESTFIINSQGKVANVLVHKSRSLGRTALIKFNEAMYHLPHYFEPAKIKGQPVDAYIKFSLHLPVKE